jgi:hypothetical protein
MEEQEQDFALLAGFAEPAGRPLKIGDRAWLSERPGYLAHLVDWAPVLGAGLANPTVGWDAPVADPANEKVGAHRPNFDIAVGNDPQPGGTGLGIDGELHELLLRTRRDSGLGMFAGPPQRGQRSRLFNEWASGGMKEKT